MDLETIKVSVVIAAYNSEKYLREMLDSILAQTLREIEIICVDDGSSDSTLDIMHEYAKTDRRITVLQHREKTDGAAEARNMGICHARGEYLSVLDADDYFEKDMLEKAYQNAKQTNADIVIYDGWVFDETIFADKEADFILRKEYLPIGKDVFSPEENADQLFLMTCGAAWNSMFRRSFIDHHAIRFRSFHHADDLGFVYLAYACADTISILRNKYIHYRKNSGTSQADQVHLWPETCYLALEDLKASLEMKGVFEKYRVSFGQLVMVYSIFYLDSMRDWNNYQKLYEELRKQRFETFGVYEIPEKSFRNLYWGVVRNLIRDVSAGEFIFRQLRGLEPFRRISFWENIIPAGATIAVYGAGVWGKALFCQVIQQSRYRLISWVDQNYESIGYPVISPESLKSGDVEWIIVAIQSPEIFAQVKAYLVSLGFVSEKICWIGDETNTSQC